MNYIAIDPSLISTAVSIKTNNDFKIINYCKESSVYGKTGMKKWFKMAEEFIEYRYIEYRSFDNYSEGEITKLKDYDKVTDVIVGDINNFIDKNDNTLVAMEGYNFGAQVGDLLDLVTFSTLLRKKIYDNVTTNIEIVSPSTLKLAACKLSYDPIIKEVGKRVKKRKIEWKSDMGIPGGAFKKNDIYLSIIDNKNYTDKWAKHCRVVRDDVMEVKTIPKPYEDCNDAYVLMNYMIHDIKNIDERI